MKKLIVKSLVYLFLIVLALEVWVRVLHVHKDDPHRFIDKYKVEKWVPNQEGHSVTGNRRQNFAQYHINNSGYNSYREYKPTADKIEIALVGDSFIEGFHQNYYNSLAKKIESKIPDIEVYEYGYAGYDMADQMHLMHQYKEDFDKIDQVIIGIKFSNDLHRGEYKVMQDRMALESPKMQLLKKSKLLVYAQSIGALDPPRKFATNLKSIFKPTKVNTPTISNDELYKEEQQYINNFEQLVALYGYDKSRFTLLLDSSKTSKMFIDYLIKNQYPFIDIANALIASKKPTTLVYDKHWNNHGRDIVAAVISTYLKEKITLDN
jgi:hypothetical protein